MVTDGNGTSDFGTCITDSSRGLSAHPSSVSFSCCTVTIHYKMLYILISYFCSKYFKLKDFFVHYMYLKSVIVDILQIQYFPQTL